MSSHVCDIPHYSDTSARNEWAFRLRSGAAVHDWPSRPHLCGLQFPANDDTNGREQIRAYSAQAHVARTL
eukprot:1182312-Pleurochrysis_carterae.AAC.3